MKVNIIYGSTIGNTREAAEGIQHALEDNEANLTASRIEQWTHALKVAVGA